MRGAATPPVTLATDALFAPLDTLPGVGKRNAAALEEAEFRTLFDLVLFAPSATATVLSDPGADEAQAGDTVLLNVTPERYRSFGPGGIYLRVECASPGLGKVDLVFFRVWPQMAEKQYPLGAPFTAEGKLEHFNNCWQIAHPVKRADRVASGTKHTKIFYSARGGVQGTQIARFVGRALEALPAVEEWLDPGMVEARGFPVWNAAVRALHGADGGCEEHLRKKAIERLAYDEILAHALTLRLARAAREEAEGIALPCDGAHSPAARAALPFTLTAGQEAVIEEIEDDLRAPAAMMRLLQGDVGSGKTVVAMLSALRAPEAGYQAAVMAPTEILARQLFAEAERRCEGTGVIPVLLTGTVKGAARREALKALENGTAGIAVGTHALFQEGVAFHNLGLAVIDEQHRFGVGQRLALAGKAPGVNVLLMSATPIPRTLTLALYGDIAVSRLQEKPADRLPVETKALSLRKLDEAAARVINAAENGAKIYWICPLVNESDECDITAAETRAAWLRNKTAIPVALAHGQMKPAERTQAMEDFRSGEARILVATTVIEVGVDVPDATIIVIEHAERFGLSQLHQLRGRVGRGKLQSYCILLHGAIGNAGRERLSAMRSCYDGFVLAEEDLRLRGAGNLLGQEQSGAARFRCADIAEHAELFREAHKEAALLLQQDPDLSSLRGKLLRRVMRLHGFDAAQSLLRTG